MDRNELLEKIGKPLEVAGEVLEIAIARLDVVAAAETVVGGAPIAPIRPRRTISSRWIAAATVVTVAALLAVALNLASGPSAAAASLTRLSKIASAQPAPSFPGPGQFLFEQSESGSASILGSGTDLGLGATDTRAFRYTQTSLSQTWLSTSVNGLQLEDDSPPTFLTSRDRAIWVADGSPALPSGKYETALGSDPVLMAISQIQPDDVAHAIETRSIEGGPPGPAENFVQAGDLLGRAGASPALRAALFRYVATIPGVIALGTVTIHGSARGLGFGFVSGGVRTDYVFSPSTSAVVGERTVEMTSGGPVPVGTATGWTVDQGTRVVNALPSTRGYRQGPPVSPPLIERK